MKWFRLMSESSSNLNLPQNFNYSSNTIQPKRNISKSQKSPLSALTFSNILIFLKSKMQHEKCFFINILLFVITFIIILLIIFNDGLDDILQRHSINFKTSLTNISSEIDSPFQIGCRDVFQERKQKRANAVLVILSRNSELEGVIESINSLEKHFNKWFNYPYVFLNDEEFNEEFKNEVIKYTKSDVKFGIIEPSLWNFPNSLNKYDLDESLHRLSDNGIMYGSMESYHLMCRFYSGFFYKHPLLQEYDWYWRVEPKIDYFCDITYDPFIEMEKHNKKYGFVITIKELTETIPNLFRFTKQFMKENNISTNDGSNCFKMFTNNIKNPLQGEQVYLKKELNETKDSEKLFNSENLSNSDWNTLIDQYKKSSLPDIKLNEFDGEEYNLCHFWSNFEIARLDIYKDEKYQKYFDFLESTGGFYKERWGDAPVHSLAVGMFLAPSEVHYFRDFGYRHSTIGHCPANAIGKQLDTTSFSSTESSSFFKIRNLFSQKSWDTERSEGIGCRCKCDYSYFNQESEDSESGCARNWGNVIGAEVWKDEL